MILKENEQARKLEKKIRKYHFLCSLPIPFFRKKWKKRYLKNKDLYRSWMRNNAILTGEDWDDSTDKTLIGISINESSLIDKWLGDRKKVLLITHEASNTGAPLAHLFLAESLRQLDFIPVILSPMDGSLRHECEKKDILFLIDEGLHYSCLALSHIKNLKGFAEKFDLVILSCADNLSLAIPLSKQKTPVIWWLHEGAIFFSQASLPKPFLKQALESVDCLLGGGSYTTSLVNKFLGYDRCQNLLYGLADSSRNSSFHIPPSNQLTFAVLGSINSRKRQDIFIKAVALLPEHLRNNATWLIVGTKETSTYSEEIDALLESTPEVKHLDTLPLDEYKNLLQKINVVISTSIDDPMPIVLTDAFMNSKIVISSDQTGTASLIQHGLNGFVFPSEDHHALAEIIQHIIENPEELPKIAAKGREIYESHFTEDAIKNNLNALISKLLPTHIL